MPVCMRRYCALVLSELLSLLVKNALHSPSIEILCCRGLLSVQRVEVQLVEALNHEESTYPALVGLRKQSVKDVERILSFMEKKGNICEAEYIYIVLG